MSFCALSIMAQNNITVTGVVTDEMNEPLVGVNITVKDQPGFGSITDIDGRYSIKVERYSKLIFSYIGFEKQEVLVKDKKNINIKMKESSSSMLDEVVITGTGAQKKLTVTGAISTVKLDEIESVATNNISNALAGNIPGVLAMQTSGQPGENTSEFWIRGISTFGASSSALVLVDGFERDLDEVNIEDVESFSVLKDASATAIYGPRGANGVVLITTKRGKAGKMNVSAKVQTSYNSLTIVPEFVDGFTYASMVNEARITRNESPIYQPDELELFRLGLDPDLYPNVDWADVLLKDGAMTYRASVNLNGGSSTARYFVSLAYLNEEGMYKTDETIKKDYDTNANSKRWNYRLNTDIDITKTTLLKVGVSGSLRKVNSPGLGENIWTSIMYQNPVAIPVMYSNGYIPAVGEYDKRANPWVMATQTGYIEKWDNKVQTNITLEQKLDFITKGLSFEGRFGFDVNNSSQINRKKMPETWLAQRFRDANGQLVFTRMREEEKMSQSSSSTGNRTETFEAILNYNRNFKGHRIGGTLKYSQDSKVNTVGLGTDIKNGIARKYMGLAGRIHYNWKYRYFIDFNFGYNGSENFADGHRFGFFPAVSAAWNVAEEKFVKKNLSWLNMFKLRYSYGKVGNADLGVRFPYLYTIGNGSAYNWGDYSYNNNFTGLTYTELASNNVTWEIATKHDLGLDLSVFNDKFTATVDYFHEQRDGIYMERAYLPAMVGVSSNPKANVGSVLSTGFDGNFAYIQRVGNVDLTFRGNITYSKNKILEKDEENSVYPYLKQAGYYVSQNKGLIALGLFKDYEDIRNSPTQEFGTVMPGDIKYKDVNGDGVVNASDKVAVGTTNKPNMVYGFGLAAKWKGLDVNVHFQGAGRCTINLTGPTVYAFSQSEWGNVLKYFAECDRWISADISGDPSTENPNAEYPRLSYGGNSNNYQASSFWLRNGSYLRLKTLEIGYTLPKHIVNKIRFNNIRIFFIGSNLLTFSKFKLWDPELGSNNGVKYPLTKSLTLGLSVNL